MITANIIKDSINPNNGIRITTFELEYPRIIHSELLTHRVFSRNSSSSRAIPYKAQLRALKASMFVPETFYENKRGMQGGNPLSPTKAKLARITWKLAGKCAAIFSGILNNLGVHKQHTNRLVEPFSNIKVVLTGTEFNNFFALRYHPEAQPEIMELAKRMYESYSTSVPEKLKQGDWHLPYISNKDISYQESLITNTNGKTQLNFWKPLIEKSVARCARVSYNNFGGREATDKENSALFNKLKNSGHFSPMEHQAKCLGANSENEWYGNLRGWQQYRKLLINENITTFIKEANNVHN